MLYIICVVIFISNSIGEIADYDDCDSKLNEETWKEEIEGMKREICANFWRSESKDEKSVSYYLKKSGVSLSKRICMNNHICKTNDKFDINIKCYDHEKGANGHCGTGEDPMMFVRVEDHKKIHICKEFWNKQKDKAYCKNEDEQDMCLAALLLHESFHTCDWKIIHDGNLKAKSYSKKAMDKLEKK